MVNKAPSNPSQLVQNHRLGFWILLLVLTATILLFPVHLRYEYHAIESISVFGDNLPLFGILYCIWLAILLLLLFTKGKSSEWQRIALVCIFALGFFGIWIINTPYGGHWDIPWNMGHVKYLEEMGRIAFAHPVLNYFQFPGIHLLVFSLSEISGLGIFTTITLFLLFSGMLVAALLYLLFVRLLKSPYLASFGVLLMLQGTLLAKQQSFWPGNLSLLLLIVLLVLLSMRQDKALGMGTPGALVMIILMAAFIMSYLPTPVYFFFILAGIYLLQKAAKKSVVRPSTIVLFLVLFLAWEMYFSIRFFGDLIGLTPTFIAGFVDPGRGLPSISGSATGHVGEAIPLWASLTRLFWLALIFGVGAILEIWNLVKAKRLDSNQVLETGGLLGITFFAIASFVAVPQAQWARFMVLAPLFTIPIILRFLSGFSRHNGLSQWNILPENSGRSSNPNGFRKSPANFGGWFRRHVFTLLIIVFFVLSLPTFLVTHERVLTPIVYSYEMKGGEFIESAYGGEGLNIFSTTTTLLILTYYMPEAEFQGKPVTGDATGKEDLLPTLLVNMDTLLRNFQNQEGNAIFVLSSRFILPGHIAAEIEPTNLEWVERVNRLAENNKIYDNGYIEIYER